MWVMFHTVLNNQDTLNWRRVCVTFFLKGVQIAFSQQVGLIMTQTFLIKINKF